MKFRFNNLVYTTIANPVMIKELRQTVKGRLTILGTQLLMGVLLVGTWLFLTEYKNDRYSAEGMGQNAFAAILIVLSIICWGIMPLILYFRTSAERRPEDFDLMYITRLTPHDFVLGKYMTALSQIFLYLFTCLPFLTLPYLFEGIDIFTMYRAVVQIVIATILAAQIAILLGTIPKKKFLLFLFAAAYGFMVFGMIVGMVEAFLPFVFGGYSRSVMDPLWNLYALSFAVLLSFALYILNYAFIMPDTANRAMGPRLYFTMLWLVSYGIFFTLTIVKKDDEYYGIWTVFAWFVSCVTLLFGISERDRLSPRVTKTIPKGPLRWLVFPFYSGSGPGILWSLGMIFLTISTGYLTGYGLDRFNIIELESYVIHLFSSITVTSLIMVFYCLLVYYITRSINARDLKGNAWLITLILVASLSLLIWFLDEAFSWGDSDLIYLLSPFGAMVFQEDSDIKGLLGFIAMVLCCGVGVLSMKHIGPQIIRFRRTLPALYAERESVESSEVAT